MKTVFARNLIASACLQLTLSAVAQVAASAGDACHAVFHGSSALHDFEGAVNASAVQTTFSDKTWTLRIEFPVAAMNTRNAGRDKNMRKMFEVEKFPLIAVSGKDLAYPGGAEPVKLTGTIKIRDREQPGSATLENFSLKDGVATFTLKGEVSLAAFQLKPPSAMLGMFRVGDKVKLEGRLTIRRWPRRASQ